MTKGRALLRVLLALCTAALLLGDVFRGFHLLSVQHVVCAEHGELVHAEEIGATAVASGRSEALPGGNEAHHHDHCGLAAAPSRLWHLAVASAAPSVTPSSAPEALLVAIVRGERSRAVLSYAPKQSPPLG